MTDLVFSDTGKKLYPHGNWKVLIVDDARGIHSITRTVLRNLIYDNKNLEFYSAYSRREAEELLSSIDDFALVLLDVVMDEDDSGLKLIKFIREELNNSLIRIILRTGNPGMAPEMQVIVDYDINDYEVKTDLTALKLYTMVLASLRNYSDLVTYDRIREGQLRHRRRLSRISESSAALFGAQSMSELVSNIYRELNFLLRGENDFTLSSYAALEDDEAGYRIVEVSGEFSAYIGSNPEVLLESSQLESLRRLKMRKMNLLIHEGSLYLYEDARRFRFLIHFTGISGLELQDRQLLDIFASNISVAFENLRLNREITGTQEELINKLSGVVETRSHDTAQHVQRVGLICELIAGECGIEKGLIHNLQQASAMHDIGKIGIPDEILLKPGVLTDEEFSIMKTHTTIGYSLLEKSNRPLMRMAAKICLEHHEKFDGTGYPRGLRGFDIGLNSRIVSICDVFDSITHGRLHRDPWPIMKAADYLESEKSKSFDPQIVDIFIKKLPQITQINNDYPD